MINLNLEKRISYIGIGIAVSGIALKIITLKTITAVALAAILPYGLMILGVSLVAVGCWMAFKNRNIEEKKTPVNSTNIVTIDNQTTPGESKDPNIQTVTVRNEDDDICVIAPESPLPAEILPTTPGELKDPNRQTVTARKEDDDASDNEADIWVIAPESPLPAEILPITPNVNVAEEPPKNPSPATGGSSLFGSPLLTRKQREQEQGKIAAERLKKDLKKISPLSSISEKSSISGSQSVVSGEIAPQIQIAHSDAARNQVLRVNELEDPKVDTYDGLDNF